MDSTQRHSWPRLRSDLGMTALLLWSLLLIGADARSTASSWITKCNAPQTTDIFTARTPLYGHQNDSDAAPNDQVWAYRKYGPITRLELFKANFYDGVWHDPGEMKGVQPWYQSFSDNVTILFGARKPHMPFYFELKPGEHFVRVEVQYDTVMRFIKFTTNHGRDAGWGFPNVKGAFTNVTAAPTPGSYLAAIWGQEGKQLPPAQGGYKKRYVIRIGFLWAQAQNCTKLTLPVANQIKADLPPVIQPMGVYFTPTPIPPRVFPPLVTPKGPTKPAVTGSSSGAVLASVSPNASKRVASMSG
eukprot:jgi/Chrzof1/1978/Cz10g28190.t1